MKMIWKWRKGGTGGSSLYLALLWVTAGLVFFCLMMTVAAAHVGYSALSSATQEAAWSGQAMIKKGSNNVGGAQGYFQVGEQTFGNVGTAVQTTWDANVNSMGLGTAFQNLSETYTVQNNQVSVTATGDYDIRWIDNALSVAFGSNGFHVTVPMKVTMTGTN